jgi:membrane-bound lytic murein transglycosylase B
MRGLRPDPTGLDAIRSQPEFTEQLWQYLNRRVSDWRVITGKQKASDYDALLGRIERDFGVDRGVVLAVWGIESSYGDPVVQERYMHPIIRR